MLRPNRPLQTPTFAQTIVIAKDVLQRMPQSDSGELLERIKRRHLAEGFRYDNDQIHRALRALTDPARVWDHNRRSARST